jgi:hypothetical protein
MMADVATKTKEGRIFNFISIFWNMGLVGVLDLEFQFDLTASAPGDGFYVSFVTGTVHVPSGSGYSVLLSDCWAG